MAAVAKSPARQIMARKKPLLFLDMIHEYTRLPLQNLFRIKKVMSAKQRSVSLKSQKDEKTGRMMMIPVEGTEKVIPVDLVLIAAGFLGSQKYITDAFNVELLHGRTNVETKPEAYETSVSRVFTAGDMHRGQSLVVWAIREGREAARAVDESLMGYTNL